MSYTDFLLGTQTRLCVVYTQAQALFKCTNAHHYATQSACVNSERISPVVVHSIDDSVSIAHSHIHYAHFMDSCSSNTINNKSIHCFRQIIRFSLMINVFECMIAWYLGYIDSSIINILTSREYKLALLLLIHHW